MNKTLPCNEKPFVQNIDIERFCKTGDGFDICKGDPLVVDSIRVFNVKNGLQPSP
jgi:hypothetical protein